MSPFQMAKEECAAMVDNGCDGMRIDNALKVTQAKGLKRCLLLDDKRCPYFEACVMPMAAMVTEPDKSKAYLNCVADYKFQHHIRGLFKRCPDCGGALPARRRFCPDCTQKHRRKSNRDAVRRFRDQAVSS